eukprot:10624033-Ditylum_brightwellii.AAC.2
MVQVRKWFKELCKIGPPLGYFPERDKSIFVTNSGIMTGGYIGEGTNEHVANKVKDWVESVKCLLPMVRRNPQAVHSLQPITPARVVFSPTGRGTQPCCIRTAGSGHPVGAHLSSA